MATLPNLSERSCEWSPEVMAMAAQTKVLSGNKLEQLVVRLQRHTGRPKEACWRLIIQHGSRDGRTTDDGQIRIGDRSRGTG